ncbi:MAG TPA: hypothetical protein PL135_08625, partial [Spirochaetota bacterium]|nr:hypothetical protein [Spirochaetota bacterium]
GVLARLKRIIRAKRLHAQDLVILHGSLRRSGEFVFSSFGYPAPLLYRPGRGLLPHRRQGRSVTQSLVMQPGDIMFLCCDDYHRALSGDPAHFAGIMELNRELPLLKLRSTLVRSLSERAGAGGSDRLLVMVRMEEGR